jgi:ABC-type amino acid transport substrate-binding protein
MTAVLGAAVMAVSFSVIASDFEQGRKQFQRTCAQCHGHNMVNSGVTVYDLRKFPLDQRERFFRSVGGGKGNMPSFKDALSEEQIRWLWAYVGSRGEAPRPEQPAPASRTAQSAPEQSGPASRAEQSAPFRVCAAEANPPLSYAVNREPRGLDVAVAKAIAAELKRPLELVFFESEYDHDKTLAQEVNALLSSKVCDLASAFALFASDLGAPPRESARAPDYEGAKPRRQRPFIPLSRLAGSRAYYAMAMGVITRDPALRVDTLADLQNSTVGAVTGTMAGAALMFYRNGILQARLITLSQREDLLAALEAGRFDATLTPLSKYDAYRLAHPDTRLARAKFIHPLRINMGFVGLENETAVLSAANRAIERALANGDLKRWAEESGATWIAPEPPDIQPAIGIGSLRVE